MRNVNAFLVMKVRSRSRQVMIVMLLGTIDVAYVGEQANTSAAITRNQVKLTVDISFRVYA